MTEAEQLVTQFKEDAAQARKFYTVAVYMEDRAYGGPEEGGWYFDTATLVMEPRAAVLLRGFDNAEQAHNYAEELNFTTISQWNEGRPEVSSVLSSVLSEGRYYAIVNEGMPQPYYPEERPRYS